MPEMLESADSSSRSESISHKTCDTLNVTGLHTMESTVHLAGLRCDGWRMAGAKRAA